MKLLGTPVTVPDALRDLPLLSSIQELSVPRWGAGSSRVISLWASQSLSGLRDLLLSGQSHCFGELVEGRTKVISDIWTRKLKIWTFHLVKYWTVSCLADAPTNVRRSVKNDTFVLQEGAQL